MLQCCVNQAVLTLAYIAHWQLPAPSPACWGLAQALLCPADKWSGQGTLPQWHFPTGDRGQLVVLEQPDHHTALLPPAAGLS